MYLSLSLLLLPLKAWITVAVDAVDGVAVAVVDDGIHFLPSVLGRLDGTDRGC